MLNDKQKLSYSQSSQIIPSYHNADSIEPECLHENNKYDPDEFWDGETIADDTYYTPYNPKLNLN